MHRKNMKRVPQNESVVGRRCVEVLKDRENRDTVTVERNRDS